MNTRRTFHTTSFMLVAFGAIALGQACSKDDSEKPTVLGSGGSSAGATGKGGSAGKGGAIGSGGASTNGGTAQGGDAPEGGAPVAAGGRVTGTGGTDGQPAQQGGDGGVPAVGGDCFSKPKTTPDNLQFLNRCTDSRCSPFDNAQRIPGFTGTLPPL